MIDHMLPVNHIYQENDCYCGPASAQMVLKSLKKNIEHQYDLFTDESHELVSGATQPAKADICRYKIERDAVWTNGSTPKGLMGTLQKRVDAADKRHVGWFASPYGGGMTRKICWAIVNHTIPPIALVHGEGHWLVVAGCELSSDPASSTDHGYSIERLHLLDPYSKIADDTPPSDIAITISRCDWQNKFFTGAPSTALESDEAYASKFIAIIDDDSVGEYTYQDEETCPLGDHIMSESEAVQRAIDFVDEDRLFRQRDPWTLLRGNVVPVSERALPVMESGEEDDATYLVHFRLNTDNQELRNRIVLIIGLARRDGVFRRAIATFPESGLFSTEGNLAPLNADQIVEHFVEGIQIGANGPRYIPNPNQPTPRLFWWPCLETLTPFLPFYPLKARLEHGGAGGNPEVTVNVRLDGRAFLDPPTDARGARIRTARASAGK